MTLGRNKERQVFSDAIELPEEERYAFVKEACEKDGELFERVLALLGAFTADSPVLRTEEGQSSGQEDLTEGPGTMIGRYKLLQKIGEGGMGVVYMAEQTKPVVRKVALKIIKWGMDTKQVVARFEAERQALAIMDHPNIAKVLDGGSTETGRPFFVMELVQGIPVTHYCDKNKLTARERIDLFIPICQAIQHAHQKGVIHRDIKPTNVMVSLLHGEPVPKVIDFGIAKATNQKLTQKTLFTDYATMIGTPAYMSPEQAEMSIVDVDSRTDVYSLGVLLYELLTGTVPFPEKRLLSQGYGEMQRIIAEEEPNKPSTRFETLINEESTSIAKSRSIDVASLQQLLRGDLDWITMKCLEKDRRRRYETATGLAVDLERHLSDEPVSAAAPRVVYRLQKAWRRNKVIYSAGAAVFVSLILGITVSVRQTVVATLAKNNALAAEAEKEVQRREAVNAREAESRIRILAEKQERIARHRAYAADMNLGQRALELNNIGEAKRLLDRYRPTEGGEDMRGWEWRYLWQFCQSDALFELTRLGTGPRRLSVSSDGRWLVAGSMDIYEKGEYWDLAARRPAPFPWGDLEVHDAAFLPSEPLIAVSHSQEEKGYLRFIEPVSKDVRRELGPYEGIPGKLTFSKDGSVVGFFLPGSTQRSWQFNLYDVETGEEMSSHTMAFHSQLENSIGDAIALAPDQSVAAYSQTGSDSIRVIDALSGELKWQKKAADDRVTVAAFSPDSRLLVTGEGYVGGAIRVWDAQTGEEYGSLIGQRGWTIDLAFLDDGTLVSGCADQTIRFWNLNTLQPMGLLKGQLAEVWRLAVLPDTRRLISGGQDGRIMAWDYTLSSQHQRIVTLDVFGDIWRFTSDGDAILAVDLKGRLIRCSGSDFDKIDIVFQLKNSVNQWAFSEDGGHFAARSADGSFDLLNVTQSPAKHWTFENPVPVRLQAVLPERNSLLVIRNFDNELQEWDLKTGEIRRQWPLGIQQLPGEILAVSSNGDIVALCDGSQFRFRFLDMRSGKFLEQDFDAEHFSATFSPDRRYFGVSSEPHVARFRNFPELTEAFQLRGHQSGAKGVCFAPDMSRVFTSSGGKQTLMVWDYEQGHSLLTLEGAGSFLIASRVSPNGNVVGAGGGKKLNLWRAPSWEEIEEAEAGH